MFEKYMVRECSKGFSISLAHMFLGVRLTSWLHGTPHLVLFRERWLAHDYIEHVVGGGQLSPSYDALAVRCISPTISRASHCC